MKHTLQIRVSKDRSNDGIVTCRRVSVRERLLRFFLGNPVRLTVLVPGEGVDEVDIRQFSGTPDHERTTL